MSIDWADLKIDSNNAIIQIFEISGRSQFLYYIISNNFSNNNKKKVEILLSARSSSFLST
jgi:hypothetical protein